MKLEPPSVAREKMSPPGPKTGLSSLVEEGICRGGNRRSGEAIHRRDSPCGSCAANTIHLPSGEMSYPVTANPGRGCSERPPFNSTTLSSPLVNELCSAWLLPRG